MNMLFFAAALKVLMIGNSFSVRMVESMPPVARDLGLELDICSLYIGGCSLERHCRNCDDPESAPYDVTVNYRGNGDVAATPLGSAVRPNPDGKRQGSHRWRANIPQALAADKWSVVTVQQASHFSWQPATYRPWGGKLVETVRREAPSARIYVQETWSYTPWDRRLKAWNITQDEMYHALHGAYAAFAAEFGCAGIIPTGTAVQRLRSELPVRYTENSLGGDVVGSAKFVRGADGTWQPQGDVFHMGPDGNYLQALVWTEKLFGADVTKCTYAPAGMSPARAALLRDIAHRTVLRTR